jgi:hypothetical protein
MTSGTIIYSYRTHTIEHLPITNESMRKPEFASTPAPGMNQVAGALGA